MRDLLLLLVLAGPVLGHHHEGRGIDLGRFGQSAHDPLEHDHEHPVQDDGEATVTDAPETLEGNADDLSSTLHAFDFASLASSLGDEQPADQKMTDESAVASEDGSAGMPEEPQPKGLNSEIFERIFGRDKQQAEVPEVTEETPDPRIAQTLNWAGVTPQTQQNPWGVNPWAQQQQSIYHNLYNHYDPYADYGYGYGYGYGYPSPYYSSDLYDDYEGEHKCPKCHCDKYEDEHHNDKDDEEPYDNDLDDYLRTTDNSLETEGTKKRSKRSTDYFDFHSVHKPSKFLEQHNVGYRIKNHLRYRLREENYPLHYGHILTGSHYGKHRSFDDYADFHVGYDANAFSKVPIGPKLGYDWIDHGFPVYGYNLYKLWKPVYGVRVTKNLVNNIGLGALEVIVKPGTYRMVGIMDDKKGLIIEKVGGTYHGQRYILSHVFHDGTLHKFQAMAAWKDHHATFFRVSNKLLGLIYLVRPSNRLDGGNPKVNHHYGKKHDRYRFSHLKHEPSLLRPHNTVKKIRLGRH